MMTGTIVASWQDAMNAYLSIRVVEANGASIEYIGQLPVSSLVGLTASQQTAALAAAVAAVRANQITPDVALGLSGQVTL